MLTPELNKRINQFNTNKTSWQTWWRLLRPHTLSASFIPVAVGTALALNFDVAINLPLFLAMLVASILIQAATNMFNEYYDYKRGLDNPQSVGIGGAIVREGVSATTVLALAIVFYALAVGLGFYICWQTTFLIALVGSFCMLVGYLYTGGPYPIAYTPFGELLAGLFMGPVIILIAFYLQTEFITLKSFLVSIPIGILIGAILMANNIRDLDGDKKNGRRTLAILLGNQKAIVFLAGMFLCAYLWVIVLALMQLETWWALVTLASVPKAWQSICLFIGKKSPLEMMPAMQAVAKTNTYFGFLLALGLFIGSMF